jgi:MFS-type transporter involved in bile tolerance (Atg22 family)
MYSYVNDETVRQHLGTSAIGLMGATQSGTTALLSMPASWLATRFGQGTVLAIGSCCYIVICLVYLISYNKAISAPKYIVPLFVAFGVCRVTWENMARAIYGRLFSAKEERAPAFAALNVVMSLSAAVFAFLIDSVVSDSQYSPYKGARPFAWALLVPACLIVPGYIAAVNQPPPQHQA